MCPKHSHKIIPSEKWTIRTTSLTSLPPPSLSPHMRSGLKWWMMAQNASPSRKDVVMLVTSTSLWPRVICLLHSSSPLRPVWRAMAPLRARACLCNRDKPWQGTYTHTPSSAHRRQKPPKSRSECAGGLGKLLCFTVGDTENLPGIYACVHAG